jgi:Domain of unknown function (DUF3859)
MHYVRLTAALGIVLVVAGCASAPPSPLEARFTEYGLYTRGSETVRPDAAVPSGQSRGSYGNQLRQTTRVVPLVLGTSFGFCYEIAGVNSGASPQIVIEVAHPSFARPGKQPTNRYSFPRKLVPRDGVISDCAGYGFDHDFELVQGAWRFTVVLNGTPMLTQEFSAR